MSAHERAAILAIGDEITLGQKTDTNSGEIARCLVEHAVRVTEYSAVPDDRAAIADALTRLALTNDLVIATGGLGPTADDLTRIALADAVCSPLVEDGSALAHLRERAFTRGRSLSPNQRLQAQRPESATLLENHNGTAPAILAALTVADGSTTTILCLPGPPREMRPILDAFVRDTLRAPSGTVIRTRILHAPALAEAEAGGRLGELMDRERNPLVGTTASGVLVDIRLRYEGPLDQAAAALDDTEHQVRRAIDPFVLPADAPSLQHAIVELMRERGAILATAESCTGGLIARRITDVEGSSDVFDGGWVTYSNKMKRSELGVSDACLDAYGAVSAQTAREMAFGALAHAPDATCSLSVTGIAGPGGGTADKPVGTVFIACAHCSSGEGEPTCLVKRFIFPGDRASVRSFTANVALAMLRFELLGIDPGCLLAEVPNTG